MRNQIRVWNPHTEELMELKDMDDYDYIWQLDECGDILLTHTKGIESENFEATPMMLTPYFDDDGEHVWEGDVLNTNIGYGVVTVDNDNQYVVDMLWGDFDRFVLADILDNQYAVVHGNMFEVSDEELQDDLHTYRVDYGARRDYRVE